MKKEKCSSEPSKTHIKPTLSRDLYITYVFKKDLMIVTWN